MHSAYVTTARETMACEECGILESIHLIDAKADVPEGASFEEVEAAYNADRVRMLCIACYGPGWLPCGADHVHLSIAPSLAPHYAAWRAARTLCAIRARINGEWDNPDLVAFGPISTDTTADILAIIDSAAA